MAASNLWTPDGDITTHQNVDTMSRREMELMMHLHDVATKYGFNVTCNRCGGSFAGNNASPNSRLMSIACGCREIRAEMRQGIALV